MNCMCYLCSSCLIHCSWPKNMHPCIREILVVIWAFFRIFLIHCNPFSNRNFLAAKSTCQWGNMFTQRGNGPDRQKICYWLLWTFHCTAKMQGLNFILCGCCRLKKTCMLEVDLSQERRIFMCIKLQITSQGGGPYNLNYNFKPLKSGQFSVLSPSPSQPLVLHPIWPKGHLLQSL
jgi:hypothetical protein